MRRTIWTAVALVSAALVASRYLPQVSLANATALARQWEAMVATWVVAVGGERIPWELLAPLTAFIAAAALLSWLVGRSQRLGSLCERGWSPARISKKTRIAQDGVRMVLGARNIRSLERAADLAARNIRPVEDVRGPSANLRNQTGLRRRSIAARPGTRLATSSTVRNS